MIWLYFNFFIFLILYYLFVTCYPMKLQNDLRLFYYIAWLRKFGVYSYTFSFEYSSTHLLLYNFDICLTFSSKKGDCSLSLPLSLILIFSCHSNLDWWLFIYFFSTFGWYTLVVCFLSYLSHILSIPLIVLVWINF